MKKLIVFAALLISAHTFANTPLPNHRHIAITGHGEVRVSPDMAKLHLHVENTQKSSQSAKQHVDESVNKLLAGLNKFGITSDHINASRISTSPHYQYDRTQNKNVLKGYIARRDITLTLKDLDKLNELMDYVLSVKVNQIRNVELLASNETELTQQALTKAIEDAKESGAALARSFKAKLGDIYSINVQSNAPDFRPMPQMEHKMMMSADAGGNQSGQYLHDELTFKASINVVFDLKVRK